MHTARNLVAALALLATALAVNANESSNALEVGRLTTINADGLRAAIAAARNNDDPVVLVNFWATWCKPCLEEIPIFMELEKTHGPRGFKLIAVSLDEVETLESAVRPFLQKWFPQFNSYISVEYDMDDMVSVVDNGWNEVLPTSYLFSRDGTLAERLQGKYSAAEFAAKIDALLQR